MTWRKNQTVGAQWQPTRDFHEKGMALPIVGWLTIMIPAATSGFTASYRMPENALFVRSETRLQYNQPRHPTPWPTYDAAYFGPIQHEQSRATFMTAERPNLRVWLTLRQPRYPTPWPMFDAAYAPPMVDAMRNAGYLAPARRQDKTFLQQTPMCKSS